MNKKIFGYALVFMFLAVLTTPLTSTVIAKKVTEIDMGDYTEYVGTLGGANFVVRIPNEDWNGMLVVGCHAYIPSTNWPMVAQTAQFALDNLAGVGLPFTIVEQGFAYAASSYGEGGWPIKEAMIRTHQLTEYVIDNFGVTGKVFIIGQSMGGAIGLLLGEKYPELYDGVLDISGMKDMIMGYTDAVEGIAEIESIPEDIWNSFPPSQQAYLSQLLVSMKRMTADMEAQYGGTYDDKPQHYERLNPASNAEISISMISVIGASDPLTSYAQGHSFENAVIDAGCSEYYKLYTVPPPAAHANPPTINAALSHFAELVDYPVGW